MTHFNDPDLRFTEAGGLKSLYKKGDSSLGLLSPSQVASCVKFIELKVMGVDEDNLPRVVPLSHRPLPGLKVNLIGGPTGAGKTSLIQILAGGMETEPKHESDTKCPTVYILQVDGKGEQVALLDTAGLCDTQAMASNNIDMQDLLINAVAATIQKFDMTVVSFLMCVDPMGRLPANFHDIWPHMQTGLGGQGMEELCTFVVTKMNCDSTANSAKARKLKTTDYWLQLQHSPLRWPVIGTGRENLEEIQGVLKPMSTGAGGIGASQVNPDTESLAKKKKIADDLQKQIDKNKEAMEKLASSALAWDAQMDEMQGGIDNAYEQLASLGSCKDSAKRYYRKLIDAKKTELKQIREKKARGQLAGTQLQTTLDQWNSDFKSKMEQIRKMEGIGAFFKSLAGGVERPVDRKA